MSSGSQLAREPARGTRFRRLILKDSVAAAFRSAKDELECIEARIRESFASDAEALTEISEYLLSLGGKRIRPLLTLMGARLFGMKKPSQELIDVAAGIELIHMATLLHDDIIDASPTRRKQESAYRRFGITPSLLAGDFLLVRAFGLCAHLDTFIIERTEKACIELTEGEILEGKLSPKQATSLNNYLTVISKKTASLFSLSAAVGAHIAGADSSTVLEMEKFGKHAGIAFQMIDDILDITADEDLLGKPVGTDLRQKAPSLPNVLWLESGDLKALEFFSLDVVDEASCRMAASELRSSPVLQKARGIAEDYAKRALEHLDSVPTSPESEATREELRAIVQYTLERCQ